MAHQKDSREITEAKQNLPINEQRFPFSDKVIWLHVCLYLEPRNFSLTLDKEPTLGAIADGTQAALRNR